MLESQRLVLRDSMAKKEKKIAILSVFISFYNKHFFIISDKNPIPKAKMSTPYHLLAGPNKPYNHGRFLKCEVRDIKGMFESICRGIETHAQHFPEDKINARYLNSYACRISHIGPSSCRRKKLELR